MANNNRQSNVALDEGADLGVESKSTARISYKPGKKSGNEMADVKLMPKSYVNFADNDAAVAQKLGYLPANKDNRQSQTNVNQNSKDPESSVRGQSSQAHKEFPGSNPPVPAVFPKTNENNIDEPLPQESWSPNIPGAPDPSKAKGQQDKADEEEGGESEGGEGDDASNINSQLAGVQSLPGALDLEITEAASLANHALNGFLLDGVWLVWVFALPSFGLSVLVGAIAGDLLLLLKKPLIKFVAARIKLPLLKGDLFARLGDQINDKIKFSIAVKVNVILMNVVVAVAVFIVLVFFAAVIWSLCNNIVTWGAMYAAGLGDVCVYLNKVNTSP